MNPELLARVEIWRRKGAEGTLTIEDMREAVEALREGRVGAAALSDSARRKAAHGQVRSAADLLTDLMGSSPVPKA